MEKSFWLFFMLLSGIVMISCGDDSVRPIDLPENGNGNENGIGEDNGMIYSISFDIEGTTDSFTFSVDMTDAVIESDDLPDDFEGDTFVFDPDAHEVFVSGSMIDWPQPGTDESFRLTIDGTDGGTVEAGEADYKFFIVFESMDFDDGEGWNYGEWSVGPDRTVEIIPGESVHVLWGDEPDENGDEDPDETPDALYMIGSALNMEDSSGDGTADGWDWEVIDAPMIPVHSDEEGENPHMFWKIAWFYEGGEFKFAPQRSWENNFGSDGEDPEDEIYLMGDENLSVPGETGYYKVVVNFETGEISVTEPHLYLIGETVDSWDEHSEEALFDSDNENEVFTITRELEEGELRMYSWFDKGWFTDWRQAEFMIFDGEIEFREVGDNLEPVIIESAGEYTIELNFRTKEGSIELQ
jgi:hypothetical protein